MLEHYALEDDPLEAFKQRQSRLEQVRLRKVVGALEQLPLSSGRLRDLSAGLLALASDVGLATQLLE